MNLQFQVPSLSYYETHTITSLLSHQPIFHLMIQCSAQRLQFSISIKPLKLFNIRECSIDNVIQLIQSCDRSRCHLDLNGTIGSLRDFKLFTEVSHSSSNETSWDRFVVVVHLNTFNIPIKATRFIKMYNAVE